MITLLLNQHNIKKLNFSLARITNTNLICGLKVSRAMNESESSVQIQSAAAVSNEIKV